MVQGYGWWTRPGYVLWVMVRGKNEINIWCRFGYIWPHKHIQSPCNLYWELQSRYCEETISHHYSHVGQNLHQLLSSKHDPFVKKEDEFGMESSSDNERLTESTLSSNRSSSKKKRKENQVPQVLQLDNVRIRRKILFQWTRKKKMTSGVLSMRF